MQELVNEDPRRTSFMVINFDASNNVRIYNRKEDYQGGIYVFAKSWLQFEKEDDADKQWFIKRDAGTSIVHIIEFYRERGRR